MRKKGGRPTVITKEALRKLEECFAMGASDKEACFYGDISTTALYEYQKKNPEFTERKQALKDNPKLKALTTIYKDLDNPQTAKWFLERREPQEYARSGKIHHTGHILMGNIIKAHRGSQNGSEVVEVGHVSNTSTKTSQGVEPAQISSPKSDLVDKILARHGI
jgi:hypothetical protein